MRLFPKLGDTLLGTGLWGGAERSVVSLIPSVSLSERNFGLLLGASILCSTQMVAGHAVLDELVVLGLLAWLAVGGISGDVRKMDTEHEDRLYRIHRLLFVIFAGYGFVQSLRGILVLNDLRVARFSLMFVVIGGVAWLRQNAPLRQERLLRVVAVCSAIYFSMYIAVGAVQEWLLDGNRFDLQGVLWSGTSVAMVPACLLLPAMLMLRREDKKDTMVFWWSFVSLLVSTFYYQSRFGWLALILFILLGSVKIGLRRTVVTSVAFLAFLIWFPWSFEGPLRGDRFVQYLEETVIRSAVESTKKRIDLAIGTITREPHKTLPDTATPSLSSTKQSEPTSTATPPKYSNLWFERLLPDTGRIIASKAAWGTITSDGPARMIFGTGWWTSRYEMLDSIHVQAQLASYEFPSSYKTIVRTAAFNGMLVDLGVVGILLLGSLFACTTLQILRHWNKTSLVAGAGLGLLWLSLFIAQVYDVILLYFALMPGSVFAAGCFKKRCAANED